MQCNNQQEHRGWTATNDWGCSLDKDDTDADWFRRVLAVEFDFAARSKILLCDLPYLRCMSPAGRGYS